MEDNNDEDHIVNDHDNEDSSVGQTKDAYPDQDIVNMEVHKHPHHVAHKKKWGEYILEFFMLFLAVFLGFVAENIREHVVEHNRSRDYAISLVQDLANDTTEIIDVIREDEIVLACIDSLSTFTQMAIQNQTVSGSFYYYATLGTIAPTVKWNNATLTQITQSGNLRYFKDPELLKKLSLYYSNAEYIAGLNDNDKRYREKSIELRNKILFNQFYKQYTDYNLSSWLNVPDSLMNETLPLQSYQSALLNEFANSFETRKVAFGFAINNAYPVALKTAKELIGLLKSAYGL